VIHGDDLVIATHGRGFWILDDIAPLRQANAKMAAAAAWLYQPANAIRTSHERFQGTPLPPEIPKAANPPEGAVIDYYLAAAQERVALEILDGKGQLVRRFASADQPAKPERENPVADIWMVPPPRLGVSAGMHRFVWDLRYAARDAEGPQALPGTYQARLTVAGQTLTQPFQVALDPRSTATPADLESQLQLGLEATHAIEQAADLTARIRGGGTAGTEPLLDELGKVNVSLAAVLEVANSADRRPPSQAWILLKEATQALQAQAGKWTQLKKNGASNGY
jgi:hypothetical protein